jgi:F-type H+-transporting ATPase subunit gamma
MANLKAIAIRLRSVKNIQKITQSMKMVAAAKYNRAERDLKNARPYGTGAIAFFEKAEVNAVPTDGGKELYVTITSDRGLCGGVHSNVCKKVRAEIVEKGTQEHAKIFCVGDKSAKSVLGKYLPKNITMVGNEIGRLPPQFGDASKVATQITDAGDFDSGKIVFNRFKTVVSYKTSELPIFSNATVEAAENLAVYDSLDADVLQSYLEYSLASLIFYAMKESATSEQSSRMTAMDASSKNAGEMIEKLTLKYNRTRQAVITGELIEIISGAAAI